MQRPLILNGFMATGKSTIGERVARETGHPFVDLDRQIEAETGTSVERLFAERGEAAFRTLERTALLGILDRAGTSTQPPVVAVGGGALISRDLRLRALDEGVVVTLEANAAEIARRALAQGPRPLLGGPNPEARVNELLELRARCYAEAHARISCEAPLEAVTAAVRQAWARDELAVAAGSASYAVQVGSGITSGRLAELVAGSPVCVLVSDRNVSAHRAVSACGVLP